MNGQWVEKIEIGLYVDRKCHTNLLLLYDHPDTLLSSYINNEWPMS